MRTILTIVVVAAAAARPGAAQVFPAPPSVDVLQNGLVVVTAPMDSPGIAASYILVRTGSRDEVEPGRTGFAHFFEHMMFRGTERYPADAYERMLQSFGADNNAYTSEDETCYTVVLPSAALPALLDIEGDRFRNLSYGVEAFQTEAHTIHGEYRTAVSDPSLRMLETLLPMAFTRHTYGHTVIGWEDDIRGMPDLYEFSLSFFRRYYTPDNTTVIVAGDVDRDSIVTLVREKFGPWRGRRDTPQVPVEPEQTEPRSAHVDWPGPAPRWMFVGWKAPGFSTATVDSAALDVAAELLFGGTGDLYERLVVQERRLLTLEPWPSRNRDPSLLVVDAKLADGVAFDEIVDRMQRAADDLAAGNVDPARVEEVKSHVRYALPMSLQTPADAAGLLARFTAATGDPASVEDYARRVADVTPQDVVRVARANLAASRRNVVTLAPAAAEAAGGGSP